MSCRHEISDKPLQDVVEQINALALKSHKFVTETTNYIELITDKKKEVKEVDHRKSPVKKPNITIEWWFGSIRIFLLLPNASVRQS